MYTSKSHPGGRHLRNSHFAHITRNRGMTLIEFMVSITIGLFLVAGMTVLIAQQSRTQAELEKSSRQIENGRYAMLLLQNEIQLAGYFGEYATASLMTPPLALPNPCTVDTSLMAAALPYPVQAYNASIGSLTADCGIATDNYVSGTDILVVRRVDPSPVDEDDVKIGQIYFQSGLSTGGLEFSYVLAKSNSDGSIDAGFNLKKKDGIAVAALRKYVVNIFFLSPCSIPAGGGSTCTSAADGGTPIPTLKRMELGVSSTNTPTFVTKPLVEGIENLQFDYGFDTSGDGAPDSYGTDVSTSTAITEWANVMAIRVNLLARNNERSTDFQGSAAYQATKNYSLGLATATPATAPDDGFKRRVFSELVRVVNPSSRRDR